ncbi:MAG: carnosine N-methyltransferase family protein [archaeon]|nr:carnosine N-methyltransferase family protein [archaeon]
MEKDNKESKEEKNPKEESNAPNLPSEEFINPMHETNGPIGMTASENDPEEYAHLKSIIAAFLNYQVDSLREVTRMERDFSSIDEKYKKRMSFNYLDRVAKLRKAIWLNYTFLIKIVTPYKSMFKYFKAKTGEVVIEPLFVHPKEIIKLRSTLKLFIRDWAIEGKKEREMCYTPILNALKEYFPKTEENKKRYQEGITVLLPGAGLGRLVYELAKLGFKAQGNEFSYYMLLCSNYILNNSSQKEQYILQPLIHSFSNVYSEEAPFTQIKIPDENLSEELFSSETGEMSMVAGEFIEVYKSQIASWDSIVTCFFLDTANNIIEYVETIHEILKKDGLWVNMGPLLYHYSEMENECSIEISWDELKHIIKGYGFEIIKEENISCTYSSVENSMMQTVYRCIFFTAIKRK